MLSILSGTFFPDLVEERVEEEEEVEEEDDLLDVERMSENWSQCLFALVLALL